MSCLLRTSRSSIVRLEPDTPVLAHRRLLPPLVLVGAECSHVILGTQLQDKRAQGTCVRAQHITAYQAAGAQVSGSKCVLGG